MKISGKLSGDRFSVGSKHYNVFEKTSQRTLMIGEDKDIPYNYTHTTRVAYDSDGNRAGCVHSGPTGRSYFLDTNESKEANVSFEENSDYEDFMIERRINKPTYGKYANAWWTENSHRYHDKYHDILPFSQETLIALWILEDTKAKEHIAAVFNYETKLDLNN